MFSSKHRRCAFSFITIKIHKFCRNICICQIFVVLLQPNLANLTYFTIMERQNLSAFIHIGRSEVRTSFDVYLFCEGTTQIAYCPSLNLSACGDTVKEAKKEFEKVLCEHLEWCVEHGTLEADLEKHGWRRKNESYSAPLATKMLRVDDTLRDIVNNRAYQRYAVPAPRRIRSNKQFTFA